MRKITKRSAAVIAATVVAIGGGAAWAAWSISGKGSASAASGTAVPLTVISEPTVDVLLPGSQSDVTFKVKNTNSFPVTITSMTYGAFTSSPNTGCAGHIEQVAGAALPGSLDLAADQEKTYVYADSLKLIDDVSNDCQGQSFTFDVVVGASS
jgi:hypothetical protein